VVKVGSRRVKCPGGNFCLVVPNPPPPHLLICYQYIVVCTVIPKVLSSLKQVDLS
jgi:hypothetical protein